MDSNVTTPATAAPAKRGVFYGWWVLVASSLANFAYAEQLNTSYGVFLHQLGVDMGWSRTALAGVATLTRIPEALLTSVLGPIVDRHGTRWLIGLGGLIVGTSFLALSTIDQLWQLYVIKGMVMSLGAACLGGFLGVTVSNWFAAKRGRALGILWAGSFLSTGVMPLAAASMIELWGWRQTWFLMGILVLVLALPSVFIVRRRPEDLGLHPDGIAPNEVVAHPADERERQRREALLAADVRWTRRQLLRAPMLWIGVFAWGLSAMAIGGTNLHLVPFVQGLGYPLVIAAGALSLRATCAMVGSPMWGLLLERVPINLAASLPFVFTAVALILFWLSSDPVVLIIALILYGIGVSGNFVGQETVWAYYFGRTSLGLVRSVANPLQIGFTAAGPVVLGAAYDMTGSYQLAWLGLACAFVLCAILVQFSRPPRRPTQTVQDGRAR